MGFKRVLQIRTRVDGLHAMIPAAAVPRRPEVVILVSGERRAGIGLATFIARDVAIDRTGNGQGDEEENRNEDFHHC